MTESSAERYVSAGPAARPDVDGIVDAYFGPRELKAAVAAEPPVEPLELVSAPGRLA